MIIQKQTTTSCQTNGWQHQHVYALIIDCEEYALIIGLLLPLGSIGCEEVVAVDDLCPFLSSSPDLLLLKACLQGMPVIFKALQRHVLSTKLTGKIELPSLTL